MANSDELNRLKMIFEENRVESFKKWPFSDKDACSIKNLAEAGFFWTGTEDEPDAAQCFICNKPLDGWESSDDPWLEHKKHSPACPFIVIGKKEDDLLFEQFYNLWKTMVRNIAYATVDDYERRLKQKADSMRDEFTYLLENMQGRK